MIIGIHADLILNNFDEIKKTFSSPTQDKIFTFSNSQITNNEKELIESLNFNKLIITTNKIENECSKLSIMLYIDNNLQRCKDVSKMQIKTVLLSRITNEPSMVTIKNISEIKNIYSSVYNYEYVDVDKVEDFPPLSPEFRYLDFLGGTKNIRGYIVPKEQPRCEILVKYPYILDETLLPIYENKGIKVGHDTSFAVPGFYIVSYTKPINAYDRFSTTINERFALIMYEMRKALRHAGYEFVNLYYDERNRPSCQAHFWLVPKIGNINKETNLYNLDLKAYLNSFRFKECRNEILHVNEKVKEYLNLTNLKEKDDKIASTLFNKIVIDFSNNSNLINQFIKYAKTNFNLKITPLTEKTKITSKTLILKIKENGDVFMHLQDKHDTTKNIFNKENWTTILNDLYFI